jgi:hypothetical protein
MQPYENIIEQAMNRFSKLSFHRREAIVRNGGGNLVEKKLSRTVVTETGLQSAPA